MMRLFLCSLLLWLVSGEPGRKPDRSLRGQEQEPVPESPDQSQCVPRSFVSRGQDGAPNMAQCEGDCDEDSDCAEGLVCKKREYGQAVPGCSGWNFPQFDYCYDPNCDEGLPPLDSSFGNHGSQDMPLCSGDCDEDADCAGGLKCFQRDGLELVPGCRGRGVPTFDYCYNSTGTETTAAPTAAPTTAPTAAPPLPTPLPPGRKPCLCVFDIDRTLTGKQGELNTCPANKEVQGVWDAAYGGGWLVLSEAAQSLDKTFCKSCYLGIVSHGIASGDGSAERSYLIDNVLISQPFKDLAASNSQVKVWSANGQVVSPLVLAWPDGLKQDAVGGIVAWYAQLGINIPAEKVYFFGDNTGNIPPFQGSGYNAREISCQSRDYSVGNGIIGLCGATRAEIKKWRGVKLCQDEPILTTPAPPAPSACICIFDVDRTLTGKQGLAEGSQCPANKIVDGVWDTAYGGGILTLSAAAQNLKRTFCDSCYLGVVSAGDASGEGSELRRVMLQQVLRSFVFDEFSKNNPQASRWCSSNWVDCPLVLSSPNRFKQNAVDGILEWYRQQGVSIEPQKVHFFGDRTENIGPFAQKGYNAREISCKERDYSLYANGMVGLCGAALEEIVDAPGIAQCSGRRLFSV